MLCRKNGNPVAIIIGIILSFYVASHTYAETFEGMDYTVTGQGNAIIFIPGLNSGASVFQEVCNAIKDLYQCHLLQLPGFAGNDNYKDTNEDFMVSMRDKIVHYAQTKKLKDVILIGHSLGGTLSLMISQTKSDWIKGIIIVDALPFYSAIQNPAATAESMQPQAEQMRTMMKTQSADDYLKYGVQSLMSMTQSPERLSLLTEWLKTSDRAATSAAIYSMMTTDLRDSINNIKVPALVLGSWAAYKPFGATKMSTQAIFTAQYEKLKQADIQLSETGYHFLMWDDAPWVNQQINAFLNRLNKSTQ